MSALRASFLLANHIAKTRKSFSEELILPVAKDIYWDLLGQAEVQKGECVPLSGSTITRWTDEIAEDIEAQLSERINESTRLLSLPTFITRQQCLFLCDIYMFQENVHEDMLCALLLPSNTTAAELCKSWNDYISGKWHWSFCIGIHTNRADTMASWFHHSDQRGHFWMWVFTLSCIEKTWLAKKCHLNLTTFWRMQVKWSITLKYTSLTYICSCSSMRRWAEHTHLLLYTEVKWLSKGRSQARVFELWELLQRFLLELSPLVAHFSDKELVTNLAHLCDTFSLPNELHLSLQERTVTVFKSAEKVTAFKAKLELWGQ